LIIDAVGYVCQKINNYRLSLQGEEPKPIVSSCPLSGGMIADDYSKSRYNPPANTQQGKQYYAEEREERFRSSRRSRSNSPEENNGTCKS
jgi:hypothetical protein